MYLDMQPGLMFMLGNHFMQHYLTVFDLDRSLIGIGASLVAPGDHTSPQESEVTVNKRLKLEASLVKSGRSD